MNNDAQNTSAPIEPQVSTAPETPVATTTTPPTPSWKQNAGIPIAIVIAAALIAGAIYFDGNRGGDSKVNVQGGIDGAQNEQVTEEKVVAPITDKDHIRGNPNAPIVVVEYSDYDCPFCKNFHETMNKVIAEYGESGDVAWVYRHFPIAQLHPNAPKIAEAAYCVDELGGDQAFWKFSDLVFGSREINAKTDMNKLPDYAAQAGVDKGKFKLCLDNAKYADQVKSDIDAAVKAGARGTPYSVVMVGGEQGVINGAQPYDVVKGIIDNLITQLKTN